MKAYKAIQSAIGILLFILTTLTAVYSQTVKVGGFNAVPNDNVDDSQAIQTAINASTVGSTIEFATGTYLVSRSLILKSDRVYKGLDGAVLKWTAGNVTKPMLMNESTGSLNNITITGLIFDGGAVQIKGNSIFVTHNTFRNLVITSWPYNNALFIPDVLTNSEISFNKFININTGGNSIVGYNLDNTDIVDNYFENVYQGMHIEFQNSLYGKAVQLSRNTGVGFKRMGIEVQQAACQGVLVEQNYFRDWRAGDSNGLGISFAAEGSDGAIIRNNRMVRGPADPNQGYGIELGGSNMTVEGNIIEGFSDGIAIGGVKSATIRNNYIKKAGINGINKYNSGTGANLLIQNNTIENARINGVRGDWTYAPGSTIEGNFILREAGSWTSDGTNLFTGIVTSPTGGTPLTVRGNTIVHSASSIPAGFTFYGISVNGSNGNMKGTLFEANTVASLNSTFGRGIHGNSTGTNTGVTYKSNKFQNLKEVLGGLDVTLLGVLTASGNIGINLGGLISPLISIKYTTTIPSPSFTISASSAATQIPIEFNGTASSDPDGSIATFAWYFGDGWNSTGSTTTHAYAIEAVHIPRLLVFDNIGALNMISKSITISGKDSLAPSAPVNLITTGKTSTSVALSWDPSTDNIGVTGYDIYAGSTLVASTSGTNTVTVTGLSAGTSYIFTVKAKDAAGNVSPSSNSLSVTTSSVKETVPPTAPSNLVSTGQTTSSVSLAWTASTDNVGVTGYDIYSGSTLVGSTTDATTFTVTGLTASTTYSYTVKAKDASGNISSASNTLYVTTSKETVPPSAPANLKSTGNTSNSVSLSWTASTDNVGVTGYNIYSGTTLVGSTTSATTYTVTGLQPSASYTFTVKAMDAAGNLSNASNAVTVTTGTETVPPTTPTNFHINSVGSTSVAFGWNASTDNIGVVAYDIYIGNNLVASTPGTTYTVTGLTPSTTYKFTLRARDAAGNVSSATKVITVTTNKEAEPPTAPANLRATGIAMNAIYLAWDPSTDNVGVTGYDVYMGSARIGTTTGATTFAATGLTPNTTYNFTVIAKDAAGNKSTASNVLTVTTGQESIPPSSPANLHATAISSTFVDLAWTPSSDNTGVTGYDIFEGTTLIGFTTGTTYQVTGLNSSTVYNFTVAAKDAAGNISPPSNALTVTTSPETIPPSVPSGLTATSVLSTEITLAWNPSSDNKGVVAYDIYEGSTLVGSTAGDTSFTVAGLTPSTSYSFTVKARDAAGNVSSPSNEITVTTIAPPDTQAPSPPLNLVSTGKSASSADLSWDTSPDNVGTTGYDIYEGTSLIGSTTGVTTYTVTGLTPATTYTFTVRAKDAAGNISDFSNEVIVVTDNNLIQDTVPPSAPANLITTGQSAYDVSLLWNASTDNIGVTSYLIYSGNILVGTTVGDTSFIVAGLSPSTTYNFTVVAQDAAGNVSLGSDVVIVTTGDILASDIIPPSVPSNLATTGKTSSSVDLVWNASTDNMGVAAYDIYIGSILVGSTTGDTSFSVTGLSPSNNYIFTVVARDAAGNVSDASNSLMVTTPVYIDQQAPTAPTGLISRAKSSYSVELSWNPSTDNISVTGYDIYMGNNLIGRTTGATAFVVEGLTPATNYSFSVRAKDAAGNVSDPSNTFTTVTENKLVGTYFGSAPSTSGNTYLNAHDGKTGTFYDYSGTDTSCTGFDLGPAGTKIFTRMKFYARPGYEKRMIGGKFQASNAGRNSGYVDLYTITSAPMAGWNELILRNSNTFRYFRYLSPAGGYGNVAEIEVYGKDGPTCEGQGILLREEWVAISGVTVASLTSDPNYPAMPSSVGYLTSFEGPTNSSDNYGSRIRGYLCAPQTGKYVFRISGDDNCELWLSKDTSRKNIVKIASVPGSTAFRDWYRYPEQKSDSILLIKGKTYYVEALMKEGTGSDHISVGWELPDGSKELPIQSNRISPVYGEAIPSGIGNSSYESSLTIYPNPARDNLVIDVPDYYHTEIELAVLDPFSRTLKTLTFTPDGTPVRLDVSDLVNGFYFITLTAGEEKSIQKLVIQK